MIGEKPMDSAELLTSPLLSGLGFRHAFFTRMGGASEGRYSSLNFSVTVGDSQENVSENVARAAGALGVTRERVYFLSQVHGAVALAVEGVEDRNEVVLRQGDALLSRNEDVAVGVRIADCVPILIGDPSTGAALAVHAGWKGVVAGIVESAIARLREAGGSPSDAVAAIGPHITVAAFEVSEDVAEALRASSPNPDVIDRTLGAKPHVDLAGIVSSKLVALGLRPSNVDRVGGCTVSEPELYFSFRRDGPRSGRHLAAIVPRAPGRL
jgi:YfiH family protein